MEWKDDIGSLNECCAKLVHASNFIDGMTSLECSKDGTTLDRECVPFNGCIKTTLQDKSKDIGM